MLKKLRLTDFKSFIDEEVTLAPLTLLVGANASGKSNFLDALQFLRALEFDLTLAEILNGEERAAPDAWPGIRGRAPESARVGTSVFTIESTWSPPSPRTGLVTHRITCRTEPHPRLESQHLSNEQGKQLHLYSQEFSESLNLVEFIEINPATMRGYGRRGAALGPEGKNLSGVLADLCERPEDKRALVDWLAHLCAPEIVDLDFVEVKELGDVMAMFVEKGGKRISARSLSDGTLRFLGTMLAARLAPNGSVLLIEEIEAGLHPTRLRLLAEYLETVARERNIQIIATTHSPVLLQWLSDEALRDAIVFGRVPEHEGTLMRRLGDLPHFDQVVQRKGIEELFTTGWLEMAL